MTAWTVAAIFYVLGGVNFWAFKHASVAAKWIPEDAGPGPPWFVFYVTWPVWSAVLLFGSQTKRISS